MRQSRGASATSSARRNLEEIVTRRSRREPGLLTAYFEANPRLDPDLTPIDDLVTLIESLYSMEVLDLLEQEGHFWNVLKTDLEGVSRTRSFKIYQAVGGSVVPYRTRRTNRVDDQPAPQKAVEFQKRTQVESPGIRRTPVEVFDWSQIPDHNNFRRVVNFDMPNVQHAPRLPRVAEPTRRWYEVLEVKPTASIEQIRSAYRAKIGQYHPDRVTGLGAEFREIAERRSKEINVAYGEAQKARG